tara:strand:- start:2232 stop:2819 length:588 start_codon:yes stop_codon:yes gene_type:complete
MKILAFCDTHGDNQTMKRILEKSKNVDLVVCGGDISVFGHNLEKSLKQLKKIKKPVLIINGNHEEPEVIRKLCKKYGFIFLHKNSYKVDNYIFFGFGGGGFAQVDKEFEKESKKFLKKIKGEDLILITHAPPHKTKVDYLPHFGHVGNKSIREFIDKGKPILAICGHLHENESKRDKIKNTIVINPGREGKILTI